jgi:hypothetical protein
MKMSKTSYFLHPITGKHIKTDKIIIKCVNCDQEWLQKIQNDGYGICDCDKDYCAKWRKWEYVNEGSNIPKNIIERERVIK